jgi:hypothetical protein
MDYNIDRAAALSLDIVEVHVAGGAHREMR